MNDTHSTSLLDPIWQRRFAALNSQIEALEQLIEATEFDKEGEQLYRRSTLYELVKCLKQFAKAQFDYFYDGFNYNRLTPSAEFPPKHVAVVTLEQISYDLEAIKWAFEQRLHGGSNVLKALKIGDKLAWKALKLAQTCFELPQNVTVVAYFQKFAEIRVIPYAPVALIGLPITCIEPEGGEMVARDYLATPHEIGHYVYWHAKIDTEKGKRPLYQHLLEEAGKVIGVEWLEEVFADTYGCLVAGPVIAQSFQDLQLRVRQEQFFTDNGKHPIPYFRPDIYTKVLNQQFDPGWATRMQEQWQAKRSVREKMNEEGQPVPPSIRYKVPGQTISQNKVPADFISDSLNINDKPVDKMIDIVLKAIDLGTNGQMSSNWWWQYADLEQKPLAQPNLYSMFKDHLTALTNELDIGLPPDLVQQPAACSGEDLHVQWLAQPIKPPDDPEWINVFRAGGWATKGPKGNPTGD